MSDSLGPCGLQHARLPCPSPSASLLKLISIELVMPSSHLILCLSLLLVPSIFSSIRVFSSGSTLCINQVATVLELQLQHQSNEYSGLIPFRIEWFDLFAVQGTVKNLLQQHSLKASILLCSTVFMVQLSHQYMTGGKTIALTRQTFVSKILSLLFNMLSRFVITFPPQSKCLLISWLQSPSAVSFGAQEYKVCHCFHSFPIYLP